MNNRHKPLHDLEDRGGGLPGAKPKEGHAKMNEALRGAKQESLGVEKAGLTSLGEKSLGDQLRERQKQARLAALEAHRKNQ